MNAPTSTLGSLLDAALELEPAMREQWLATLDPEFDALKPRLRELLSRAADVESRDFLGRLPALDLDEVAAETAASAGLRIGPYRLERPLGAGGMGTVWLASRADGLFERQVALKLPHRGLFGAGLGERMARERAILAGLEHPHVARLLDAGLTELGQPYLALEYVEGTPIDQYCRERNCSLSERLRLFLQITAAVASAHARLVVHRDLKPANILVTAAGDVKLLDFGIAKLLGGAESGAASPLTEVAGRALTPDYASPEQIRGEPITTASDIYSLGVVLHELLAGARPYRLQRDTPAALEAAILIADPEPPSVAVQRRNSPDAASSITARMLRGDLDAIVFKALRKSPADRYVTVSALADDIQRHLDGLPVLARPDSAWYRAGRFLRRHKLAMGVAAGVLLALLGTAAAALYQARVAIAERERAQEVQRFISSIFTSADPFEGGGRQLGAVDLLKQARARVDRDFSARPALRVELLNTIGWSLANLSDYAAADEVSAAALSLAQRSLPPGDPTMREARILRLELHRFQGRTAHLRTEVAALLDESARGPAFPATDRVRLLIYAAHGAIDAGDGAAAARSATEAAALAQRELGDAHALSLEAVVAEAVALRYAQRFDAAVAAAQRALTLTLEATGNDRSHARVIDARFALGSAYVDVGQAALAARELQTAIDAARVHYGPDSAFENFASAHLARALAESDQLEPALAAIDRSLALTAVQSDAEARNLAVGTGIRAHILRRLGRSSEALAGLDSALAVYRARIGPQHDATRALQLERALALAELRRFAEARAEVSLVRGTERPIAHWMSLGPDHALGVIERLQGHCDAALPLQRAALAALPATAGAVPRRHRIEQEIALCRS